MAPLTRASLVFLTVLTVALAGCATRPPRPEFAEPSFESLDPIFLDVAELRTSSNYRPPLGPPNVDHEFPVSIEGAALRWAQERLRAVGNQGEAAFVIEDASVIETQLETEKSFAGLLKNQNAYRYDATLRARLVAINGDKRGEIEVTVTRDATVLENATIDDRDAVWYRMMDRMLVDLNTEMEAKISVYLSDFAQ